MKNNKAFTLVELIVVITILAVLSTIWFVSYSWYLAWTRDTNRISQMKAISDWLNLFSTNHSIPVPDDKIDIKANSTLIAYQGYAWKNVLETITYSTPGLDPKDKTYFSFYITRDKKYFQLMAFLEEEDNLQTAGIFNKTNAVDYSIRHPTVFGDKLGILTWTWADLNIPIQEIPAVSSTWSIDIVTTTNEYRSHMKDNEVASGTWVVLYELEEIASVWWHFCGASNNILYCAQIPLFSENLVGYWDFEWGYTDKSNTENDAKAWWSTISNELKNSSRNNYVSFNWVDNCMEIPDNSKYQLNNWTVSLWVKQNNYSTLQGLFSRDAGGTDDPWHFSIRSNTGSTIFWNRIQIDGSSSHLTTSISVTKSDWNHILTTFGSNWFKTYINWILDSDTEPETRWWTWNNNPIWIWCNTRGTPDGDMDTDTEEFLNGYIDNIIIYDRQLNDSEVLELYNYQK